MPRSAGEKFGPYELVSPLGEGGMGEVWRARDTRLNRMVALKFSKFGFTERAEREARVIAALNHPHICALYDVGPDYLVMEYVEGKALGAVSIEECLRYAIQIAAAVDAAHRQGIVHRDLKPGNILVSKSGVKLLDFGLARLTPVSRPLDATITQPLTESNSIVGTLQYMSPEQLQGKEADARSDIFSFGAVLYEMLTGKRAFAAEDNASLIAAILTSDPPAIGPLNPAVPAALERVVRRCLAKDPDDRWQTARDLHAELSWILDSPPETATTAPRRSFRGALILLALAIAAAGAIWFARTRTQPFTHRRLIITSEEGLSSPHISPDGSKVAYVARGKVKIRDLSQPVAVEVADSQDAGGLFWSPDGKWIGYSTRAEIRKTSADGGPSRTVCRIATAVQGAAWTDAWDPNGIIVYALNAGGIFRVPADGGEPVRILEGTTTQTYDFHQILFLGRSDEFLTWTHKAANLPGNWIRVSRRGETRSALPNASNRVTGAAWSPAGFLLTANGGVGLSAIPMEVTGTIRSGERILIDADGESPSVDAAGTLVYLRRNAGTDQLLAVDRGGHVVEELGKPVPAIFGAIVSPDGGRVAIQAHPGLWIYDVSSGASARLVNNLDSVASPRWSADGRMLGFIANVGGTAGGKLYMQPADSSAGPQLLRSDVVFTWDWSRNRDQIVFSTQIQGNQHDIFVAKPGSESLVALAATKAVENHPEIDPTGRYMAYQSDETGSLEVYVRTFPGGSGKWAVSAGGGFMPHWSARGDELFYLKGETLMSAKVVCKDTFRVEGQPRELFVNDAGRRFKMVHFAPMPDGRRFVIPRPTGDQSLSITLVENWMKK